MAYCILKSYKLNFEPFSLFEVFRKEKNCFFLDSSLNSPSLGRYSFLGVDPVSIFSTNDARHFTTLRENLRAYNLKLKRCNIPFLGGAVGYLAYDSGEPDLGVPEHFFGFYNACVIIDHKERLFYILSLGYPEKKSPSAKLLAEANFKKIYKLLSKIKLSRNFKADKNFNPAPPKLDSNFTKKGYICAVQKAKEYIRKGDIYQVNLSQQFNCQSRLPAFEIYRRLRRISPSCFSAYFDAGGFQIISSSPERFLKVQGDSVTTRPMKGTRPRSKDRRQDAKLKNELLNSAKDKAELLMIVDLERNDLGRVCSYDSIKVPVLRQLEEYSTVFQATATVCGKLHKDKDRIDLLRACSPGGSITGCPKIRAMQIIGELEPSRRSIYTGCLGYLSFSGDMDFNILIRTILKKKDKLYFGAGGGIVADSQPEEEYQETLVKAKGIFKAIGGEGDVRII